MKIFISWSGASSQAAAKVLAESLPLIIQSLKPFISVDDLRKGGRWQAELSDVLQSTSIGIICLTKSNLDAPWIMFESGALSKVIDEGFVMPLLIGLNVSDIRPPLSQFNVTRFERADFLRLVRSINERLNDNKLPDRVLERAFDQAWPEIESQISEIIQEEDKLVSSSGAAPEDPLKKISESIEEILSLVRTRRFSNFPAGLSSSKLINDLSHYTSGDNIPANLTIDLSLGFMAELEQRRRRVLTLLYQLDNLAGRMKHQPLEKLVIDLRRAIHPIFRSFFGAEGEALPHEDVVGADQPPPRVDPFE